MSWCTPKYPSTPIKRTNATATQNSASNIFRPSTLERIGNRAGHLLAGRRDANEPLDDRCGSLGRDIPHIQHGRGALVADDLLGISDALIELRIETFTAGLSLLRRALPRLIGQSLRATARVRQRLLIGCDGGVRLVLEALRFGEIAFNALASMLQDRADTRQRDARHQQIKRNEHQREPNQLGREGFLLERWKATTVLAGRDMFQRLNLLCVSLRHHELRGSRGGIEAARAL